MVGEKVISVDKENFDVEVIKCDKPVLVDFWAQWCGPCRAVSPLMEELATEFEGKAKIVKVNVDEAGELASQFRIMSIPTIMLFKDGEVIEKIIGVRSKEDFKSILNNNL
jgi:thioredoxin 1